MPRLSSSAREKQQNIRFEVRENGKVFLLNGEWPIYTTIAPELLSLDKTVSVDENGRIRIQCANGTGVYKLAQDQKEILCGFVRIELINAEFRKP